LRLDGLEDRVNPAVNWTTVADGILGNLTALGQAANTYAQQSQGDLPILGQSVGDLAGQATQAFQDTAKALQTAFKSLQTMQNAGQTVTEAHIRQKLIASGVVRDTTGDNLVTVADISLAYDPVAGTVEVTARLGKSVKVPATAGFNFNLGLPGVPFQVTGGGRLTADVDVDYSRLTFGVRGGAFFDESPGGTSVLSVTAEALAPSAALTGTIGFLKVTAKPLAGHNAADVRGSLLLNAQGLTLPNPDPRLTGTASVHLNLDAAFTAGKEGPGLPHIATDFVMNWDLTTADHAAGTAGLGIVPTIDFNNVRLGLGSYLGNQLRPIIQTVQDVTLPLAPIHAALAAPIPGLSDLGERIPGVGVITLEKLAELAVAAHVLPPDYQLLGELATHLHNLVKIINDTKLDSKTNDPLVPLGNFSLGGNGDLRSGTLVNGQTFADFIQGLKNGTGSIPFGGLTALVPIVQGGVQSVQRKIDAYLPALPPFVRSKVREAFDTIDKQLARLQNGYGLHFPLLDDPGNGVFRLLLGQDVDFARFDARASIPDIKETRELGVWGPVKAKFTGKMDLNLELHAGTDTYGLRQFFTSVVRDQANPALLDDGFYFDAARPLAEITNGSIKAEAGVEFAFGLGLEFVAYPHLSGELKADNFRVTFEDPNKDGDHLLRVFRAGELGNTIFKVGGSVVGEFKFAVDAGARFVIYNPFGEDIVVVDGVKEVFSKTFVRGELLKVSDVNPTNPFNRPDAPVNKVDVIFDTNFENGANDGEPDAVVAQVINGDLQLYFNGVLRPENVYPLTAVKSLTILGSADDSRITVWGQVRKPIQVNGGGGTDTLAFADGDYTSKQIPTYGITGTFVGRGTRSALVGNPILYDTRITYDKVEAVDVQTSRGRANVYIFDLSVPTAVTGGEVVNNYYVGLGDRKLDRIGSYLTLWGGYPTVDNLYIDDRAQDRHVDYHVGYYGLTRETEVRFQSQYAVNGFASYRDFSQRLEYYGMDSIALAGASAGNTIVVEAHGVDSPDGPADPIAISLNTGTGDDDVQVRETSGPVTVKGQAGRDAVTVGGPQYGTQFIGNDVTIENKAGFTTLNLDDRGSALPRTVSLSTSGGNGTGTGVVFGLTPPYPGQTTRLSAIRYQIAHTDEVNVLGGTGTNKFNVLDTASNYDSVQRKNLALTSIVAGPGDDTVNVVFTHGPLQVDAGPGSNKVTVGGFAGSPGTLTGVRGNVYLRGGVQPGTLVEVNDSRLAGRYQYTMDGRRLVRTTLAGQSPTGSIYYEELTPGGFDLVGTNSGNRYTLDGTPTVAAGRAVNVRTGTGDDVVTVLGTKAEQVNVDFGAGVIQSLIVGDATHSLEGLAGRVAVTAVNPVTARVTNEASTLPHQIVIDQAPGGGMWLHHLRTGEGQSPNEKEIRFTTVSTLDLQNGTGARSTSVFGTPVGTTLNVRGAAGWGDVMWLDTSYNRILGPVNYFGEDLQDLAYFYDYVNTTPHAYTFRTDPAAPTAQRIERDGQAPFTYSGGYQIVFYAALVGDNDINVRSVPSGVFLNMVFAPGDDVTVGSVAPGLGGSLADVRGPLAFTGYGDIDVVLDDSGNLATGPKRVTMTPRSGVYSYGNLIEGLTGSSIQWRLDEQSSMDIRGGAADETYALASSSLPAAIRIDGGGGVNTLDYSAHKGLPGQVEWFTGEGDAVGGWAADDVSGHTGFLKNGVKLPDGKVGHAFGLDGTDDFVEIPDYASQTPASITLEAWVNPDTVSGTRAIVSKSDASAAGPDNMSWDFLDIDGRLRFGVYQGPMARAIETNAAVLTAGTWQHVAATFDVASQAIAIYVDGVAVPSSFIGDSNATIAVISDSASPVRIGSYFGVAGGMQGYWDGLIDEVSLFNRALSAGEVRSIFAADSAGKAGVAGGISVNLKTNTATGLRGGIANIRDVIGGAGDDILVGNGGNVLMGGAGRDVLIAGGAASTLLGGAGEDFLIGGTTAYDADPAGLNAVRDEWARTDVDYQTRKTNLRTGLLAGANVVSNGQTNTLTGEADRDLYFGATREAIAFEEGEDLVVV
jgi:hypothetical protein